MRLREILESKSSKEAAGYQPNPKNGQKCINCTMWRDPNKCSAVSGNIDPNGWCEWYAGGAYGKRGKRVAEDGRIVKGVNTTVDVGTDEIKKQAAKFGNTVDKDGVPPTLSKRVKGSSTNVAFNLGLTEGYKLQLERDKNTLVLHIRDTATGNRTEVRGKLGYETTGYDSNDHLHQLLDKIGKSANISELINGEVVTINPKHPEAEKAKAATDKAYGEDQHPNERPQPGTKPTMPAGTVKVAVSDVYDWYKLGQHISDLEGLGKHDFGQGPPGAIISFGSEEEEHKYIQLLKKTGLDTVDIDPKDLNRPKGMMRQKTDPTYNTENFANSVLEGPQDFGDMNLDNNKIQQELDYFYTGHAPVNIGGRKEVGSLKGFSIVTFSKGKDTLMFLVNKDDTAVFYVAYRPFGDGVAIGNVRSNGTLRATEVYAYLVDKFGTLYSDNKQTPQGRKIWADLAKFYPNLNVTDVGNRLKATNKVEENFADGKNPGRKGLAKRSGVNTKASVSDLRKTAKNSSGEKQRMAHWLANMKAGKAKKK